MSKHQKCCRVATTATRQFRRCLRFLDPICCILPVMTKVSKYNGALSRACICLANARACVASEEYINEGFVLIAYKWFLLSGAVSVVRYLSLLQMLLALFEAPAALFPGVLPRELLFSLELFMLLVYLLEMWVSVWVLKDRRRWFFDMWNVSFFLVTAISFGGNVLLTLVQDRYSAFVRFLRPFYVIWHHQVLRTVVSNILSSLMDIANLILVFAFYFFIMLAVFVGVFRGTAEGNAYFATPGDAIYYLFVTMTTVNFPDVMIPAYNENGLYACFFVVFLLTCTVFFLNLTTATMYRTYRGSLIQSTEDKKGHKKQSFRKSFFYCREMELIANSGGGRSFDNLSERDPLVQISYSTFHNVLSDCGLQMSDDEFRKFSFIVDESQVGTINIAEFQKSVSAVWFSRRKLDSFLLTRLPFNRIVEEGWYVALVRLWKGTLYQAMVDSQGFLYLIYLLSVLFVNNEDPAFLSRGPFVKSSANESLLAGGSSRMIVDCVYLATLCCHTLFSILVLRGKFFSTSSWNSFDLLLVVYGVTLYFIAIGVECPSGTWITLSVLFCCRSARLLGNFSGTSRVLFTIKDIVPVLAPFLLLELCVMYSVAQIGILLFNGKIDRDDGDLVRSDYGKAAYFQLSFNTIGEAYVTLFALLMINNWNVVATGFVAVTSPWSRLFFVFNYFLQVVIILNCILAFIIETYSLLYTMRERTSLLRESSFVAKRKLRQVRKSLSKASLSEMDNEGFDSRIMERWRRFAAKLLHHVASQSELPTDEFADEVTGSVMDNAESDGNLPTD
ncbi:mitochondrial two pore calcium channel protein 1 [Andalucia godoyi]|uniref:Mitochondrial two pore calcium channel protein 1 n=1 Tax=Andalucia godoyi TaxID=505711 RepID=A0A8K0F2X1_ANDGO|nr:mitochondrial two pore calcium channel protein 1 [Andalucia godoyi]|eukprot:ANDGO_04528.mRNA.1 mitochondrial two pore calcium channel protein 1